LTRHDDHIVASVAGHVGDLEIVVARVLDRIAHPRTQPAVTVVEKHADGVRAPADPGHVEAPVAVELTEANLAAVRRRETRRRSEPARRELREDLHADAVDADHDVRPPVPGDVADRNRVGRLPYVPAVAYETGGVSVPSGA
jgi:hypothetical protein